MIIRPHVGRDERREATVAVAARLARAGVRSPAVDARWLVDHVFETATDPTDRAALLESLLARREAREPVQLVIGRTWFRRLELRCGPGVFVPRPETEVVAQVAIDAARGSDAPIVLDLCTGTGAIALSLAVEVPGARIVAADVDPAAVALASENLDRVRCGSAGAPLAEGTSVEVVRSDLFHGLDPALQGRLDVLVANPPYLPTTDRDGLEPEVADHDPSRALLGGPDGHEVVDALIGLAARWLRPGGTLVLEIDERRGVDALSAVAVAGLSDGRLVPDLTGADRAVVARRPPGSVPSTGSSGGERR